MQNLYNLLSDPTQEKLKTHNIDYFDKVIEKYPDNYESIIIYINECFNFQSPLLIEEKEWGSFLRERFKANKLSEDLSSPILEYNSEEIVFAMASFIAYQKQPIWTTLVAKENLRINMLAVIQWHGANISDKQKANELLSVLDTEINDIRERLKQDNKVFGNYKGHEQIKVAKIRYNINIAHFID